MNTSARSSGALSAWARLIVGAAATYHRNRRGLLASSLAFHALLALAPLLLLLVALAGSIWGQGSAVDGMFAIFDQRFGEGPARAVSSWLREASSASAPAAAVGLLMFAFASARLATQLRLGLNYIWLQDPPVQLALSRTLRSKARRHERSALLVVLVSGPALLVLLMARVVLSEVEPVVGTLPVPFTLQLAQLLLSQVIATVLCALSFRFVPDCEELWRTIWCGASLTAVAFNVANALVGLYIANVPLLRTYGAASVLIVFLMWVHLSAQIFVLGAELTRAIGEHERRAAASLPRSSRTETLPSAGTERPAVGGHLH